MQYQSSDDDTLLDSIAQSLANTESRQKTSKNNINSG